MHDVNYVTARQFARKRKRKWLPAVKSDMKAMKISKFEMFPMQLMRKENDIIIDLPVQQILQTSFETEASATPSKKPRNFLIWLSII